MPTPHPLWVILRTTFVTLTIITVLLLLPVLPALVTPLPQPTPGLPATWKPSEPALELEWTSQSIDFDRAEFTSRARGLERVGDRLVLIRQSREAINPAQPITIEHGEVCAVLTGSRICKPWTILPNGEDWWVIVEAISSSNRRLLAARLDPESGAILEQLELLPAGSGLMRKQWQPEHINVTRLEGNQRIAVAVEGRGMVPGAWTWTPGETVQPLPIGTFDLQMRPSRFQLLEGGDLLQKYGQLIELRHTPARGWTRTVRGNTVPGIVAGQLCPPGWFWSQRGVRTVLQEPPLMLQINRIEMMPKTPFSVMPPSNLLSGTDWLMFGLGYAQASQESIMQRRLRGADSRAIYFARQPARVVTAQGHQPIEDDTVAALVTALQAPVQNPLQLFRLNSTDALIAQFIPDPATADQNTRRGFLRLGTVSTASTAIDWFGWTDLPASCNRPGVPELDCLVTDTGSRLFIRTYAGTSGGTLAMIVSEAEFELPDDIEVDGTGWLVSSF